jgi:lysyl-tRNA synthetase class 2
MLEVIQLKRRAVLLQAIRRFFVEHGFLEVDTPVRIPAPAPEAHIVPEESSAWFLQTSPELCMKRLLSQGCTSLFQICKCFRRGERGDRHLPEFTMLEWYRTGCDYRDLMADCEQLFLFFADCLKIGTTLRVGSHSVSLQPPWQRLTVGEAFQQYVPQSLDESLATGTFDEMLCTHIEPRLGIETPVFLYDYPIALGSLARRKQTNPAVAERFELYIGGLELANGFSELTDPKEQRHRFVEEREMIQALGRQPGPMPELFLYALENLEEAAGIALGVDRLAMVLWNLATIDEVVPFTPEEL